MSFDHGFSVNNVYITMIKLMSDATKKPMNELTKAGMIGSIIIIIDIGNV